jgi:hypothetical protein
LAYQPPNNSTFLSQQTSQQYFSQNKSAPVISHQPNEQTVKSCIISSVMQKEMQRPDGFDAMHLLLLGGFPTDYWHH